MTAPLRRLVCAEKRPEDDAARRSQALAGCADQTRTAASLKSRRSWGTAVALTLFFAVLGPALGGAAYIALAVAFKPLIRPELAEPLYWVARHFDRYGGLVSAYVYGVGPAAATGMFCAFSPAAPPRRLPRLLIAALAGGATTLALVALLQPFGALIGPYMDAGVADWADLAFYGPDREAVHVAFVASGAIAGLGCALVGAGPGLRTRHAPPTGAGLDGGQQ